MKCSFLPLIGWGILNSMYIYTYMYTCVYIYIDIYHSKDAGWMRVILVSGNILVQLKYRAYVCVKSGWDESQKYMVK